MIDRFDHIVLTVQDIETTCAFYRRVLGMEILTFEDGRRALGFGASKINLHAQGRELQPRAHRPTPGSADLCLVARVPLPQVIEHLGKCGVTILIGPIERSGALGPMNSVYFRDPDLNLIEVSTYEVG